ncbi:Conserved oligomeric Golgi complex subunit [Trema orientale]|uniref:Conserved oligomeric Golgi complex subunit n=1 Tax=Trema orientale TaxID=63057 RepID=A0A2P5FCV7_TREOI|nr:Conserved oligomeric Golgi complex subunit [Trema orientale]
MSTTQRQHIVSYFLCDYQLSNVEIALKEDEFTPAFFKALCHHHEIHANRKIHLRTHHQIFLMIYSIPRCAGLELMDMMAVYQEGAYERLCRHNVENWVMLINPEVNELFKTAVCCLRDRSVLFKYDAEEKAHDPLRYVGDMVGWLHQVELKALSDL